MKIHSHGKVFRRCAHCGQPFIVNPRLGRRHRYCSHPACMRASRTAAQKKWLKKNGGNAYFAGEINADRVRKWRKRHPAYWQTRSFGHLRLRRTMGLSPRLAANLRYVALQDTIDTLFALKIALLLMSRALRYKIR